LVFILLTLFLSGSGMTLSVRAGPLWPRMDSSHPEAVSRHSKAQKWLPSNFFDLWLSIDTKNSTLWAVVLANPAVKRPWRKMKIFMQKYVKIENFWYMRVIYIKRKLRTCTIQIHKEKVWFFPKKNFFLIFSIFFPKGGPFYVEIVKNFFSVFQKFWKQNPKMTFMGPFKHKQKQSHEFWWS